MNMACDSLVYFPTRKSRIFRSLENLRYDSKKSMNIGTEPRFKDLNVEVAKNANSIYILAIITYLHVLSTLGGSLELPINYIIIINIINSHHLIN